MSDASTEKDASNSNLYNPYSLSQRMLDKINSLFYVCRSVISYIMFSMIPFQHFTPHYDVAFFQCLTLIIFSKLPYIVLDTYNALTKEIELDDRFLPDDPSKPFDHTLIHNEIVDAVSKTFDRSTDNSLVAFLRILFHTSIFGGTLSSLLGVHFEPGHLLLLMLPKIHSLSYFLLKMYAAEYESFWGFIFLALSVPYITYCYSSAFMKVNILTQVLFILVCACFYWKIAFL